MSLLDLLKACSAECEYQDFVASDDGAAVVAEGVGAFHEGLSRALFYIGRSCGPSAALMNPQRMRIHVAALASEYGNTPLEIALPLMMPYEYEATAQPYDGMAWRKADA